MPDLSKETFHKVKADSDAFIVSFCFCSITKPFVFQLYKLQLSSGLSVDTSKIQFLD